MCLWKETKDIDEKEERPQDRALGNARGDWVQPQRDDSNQRRGVSAMVESVNGTDNNED